jgi:hypothetical protein
VGHGAAWRRRVYASSSSLAKGDPVLGIPGLDPHVLVFPTPENAPTETSLGLKKNWKKKGHKNHPQKKVRARPFVLARWRQKKKVGVKQEAVSRLFLFWQITA